MYITGEREQGGLRIPAAENPTYLPRHPRHVVCIPQSTHVHILIK